MNKITTFLFYTLLLTLMACTPKMNNNDNASTSKTPDEILKADLLLLQNKWKLKAIKFLAQDEIIIPTKDYYVEFVDRSMNFNMEVNSCFTKFKIHEPSKILIVDTMGCTKKCCDKDISDKLQYSKVHTYAFKKNQLILQSDNKKFEFDLVKAVNN